MQVKGVNFTVLGHVYYAAPAGTSVSELAYTLIGSLEMGSTTLSISSLMSEVKGTPFDFALDSVALIVASQDDPVLTGVASYQVQIKQGKSEP